MYSIASGLSFIVLFSAVHTINLFQKDSNNFGPYDVNWIRYEVCKGPKSKNITFTSLNIYKEGNHTRGFFNITFLNENSIDEIKIMVYSLRNNSKSLLWTYKISDPCQHFAVGSIITTFFKSRGCVMNKGSYYDSSNFNEITYKFFGSSFFYGEFMLKIIIMSKQGNILCLILVMKFTEKMKQ